MPPKTEKELSKGQKAEEAAAKKEKDGIDPKTGKLEIAKHMMLVLKDYERRCDIRKIFIFPPIKRQFKEAIDEHAAITKVVFYPTGDRKTVLDFHDSCKVLLTSKEAQILLSRERERAHKELMRTLRKDDPTKGPARLSPLLEALRNKCYSNVETLFVWGFHMDEQESATLAAMMRTGKYPFSIICLHDCLLTAPCLSIIAQQLYPVKTLREVTLDFNAFGCEGLRLLSLAMVTNRTITYLSMRYCDLRSNSALPLADIITESPVVDIFLDGNDLGVDGLIPIIGPLSDFAKRIQQEGDPRGDDYLSIKKGKKKMKRKNKKSAAVRDYPLVGPFLNRLSLTHTGIEHMGLSHSIHSMVCFRLMGALVANSPDLIEFDIFGNDFGETGAHIILEALKQRAEKKLPIMGLRIGPKLSSDLVANIIKLAPGQKKRGGIHQKKK